MTALQAVCFDVDYTILRPGDCFQAAGYKAVAREHGLTISESRWREAELAAWAAVRLRREEMGERHDPHLIDAVGRAVLSTLCGGGEQPPGALDAAVAQVAASWYDLDNFSLYYDAKPCLEAVHEMGLTSALISNTERDLVALVAHFSLGDLVDVTLASREVGLFKPAAGVFAEALERLGVPAAASVMVGDSLHDDIDGAVACGFAAAVHLDRPRGRLPDAERRPPEHALTIHRLSELPPLLETIAEGRSPS